MYQHLPLFLETLEARVGVPVLPVLPGVPRQAWYGQQATALLTLPLLRRRGDQVGRPYPSAYLNKLDHPWVLASTTL